jgi:hypothetical protein
VSLDAFHATDARKDVAGRDLDQAAAPILQNRRALVDVPQSPAFDHRRPVEGRRFRLGLANLGLASLSLACLGLAHLGVRHLDLGLPLAGAGGLADASRLGQLRLRGDRCRGCPALQLRGEAGEPGGVLALALLKALAERRDLGVNTLIDLRQTLAEGAAAGRGLLPRGVG